MSEAILKRLSVVMFCCVGLLLPVATRAVETPRVPAAVETVCLQCHGGQSGRLGEPVVLWRESIHAASGISCHDCHGGDPTDAANAMSPERGFLGVPAASAIPDFCGRCHVGVREDYLASAHGKSLSRGGAQCVTCHGNHRVRQASLDLINPADCSRCHEFGRAEEMRTAMQQVEGRIQGADLRIGTLHRSGIATRAWSEQLFALRNDFHRLFHTVDVDKVRHETAGFGRRLDALDSEFSALDRELDWRKRVGAVVVGLLLFAGVLLLLLRKTYDEPPRN